MPRLVSTLPASGRVVVTVDHDLLTPLERLHRTGEPLTKTLNRILRAGVQAMAMHVEDNT
jgi:hypothetical protein